MLKVTFKSFGWTVLGGVVSFAFQLAAARVLGASEYGKANYYLGYAMILSLFTYFGVQLYLPKVLQQSSTRQVVLSQTFWTLTLVYFMLLPIEFIILREFIEAKQFFIVALISYSMLSIEILSSYYIGIGRADQSALLRRTIIGLLNVILFVIMWFLLGATYNVYLFALIATNFIPILYIGIMKELQFRSFNFNIIVSSFQFYIVQIVYGVYIPFSRILQGQYGTFETVGVLSVGIILGNVTNIFGDSFAKVAMPEFAKAWKYQDLGHLKKVFMDSTRLNAYLVLPLAIFSILNSKNILNFLGKGFEGGENILMLLLFSQFINSFVGPNGTLLNMTNNQRYEMFNGAAKLACALILGFWLAPHFYWGIAVSIVAAEILVNVIKVLQLYVIFKIWPYTVKTFSFICVLAVIQVLGFSFLSHLGLSFVNLIMASIPFGVLVYYVSFRFSPIMQDREILKIIIAKLKV